MAKPVTIDEYIESFPNEIKVLLKQMRVTILKAAPKATEVISYNIPALKFHGMLVWFAAHKAHIGLYPRGSAIEAFSEELSVYKTAKGSIQFPFDKPLPLKLITKIVKFRVDENLERESRKKLK